MSKIRMQVESDRVEFFFYDTQEGAFFEIASADEVRKAISGIGNKPIHLRIDSVGGDPYRAVTMYHLLKEHKAGVTAVIDGVAASSASLVACAASHLAMRPSTQFMIHEPSLKGVRGNAKDLKKKAQQLDSMSNAAVEIYVEKCGQSIEQVKEWMQDETWFTEADAHEAGFCDSIEGGSTAKPRMSTTTSGLITMTSSSSRQSPGRTTTRRLDPNNPLVEINEPRPEFRFEADHDGMMHANAVLSALGQWSFSGALTASQEHAISMKLDQFEQEWRSLEMKGTSLQQYVDTAFQTFSMSA